MGWKEWATSYPDNWVVKKAANELHFVAGAIPWLLLVRFFWPTMWPLAYWGVPASQIFWLFSGFYFSHYHKFLRNAAISCNNTNVTIGMPYWGCLNVFANVIQNPFKAIINEFSGVESDDRCKVPSWSLTWPTPSRKKVSLSLVANPSLNYPQISPPMVCTFCSNFVP